MTEEPLDRCRRLAAHHLWGFLSALRRSGVGPAPPKQADFLRAIAGSAPRDITALYWYARITLLDSVADLATFDQVFDDWFRRGDTEAVISPPPGDESDVQAPQGGDDGELPPQDAAQGDGVEASALTTTGRRAFGRSDSRQRDLMRSLQAEWPARLPTIPSRRRRPARFGRRLDMRLVWRQARRNGGEILQLRWTARPPRIRRLLLLVDVSGSLKQHTPELLRLAHTAIHGAPTRTEVFTFGTRLTRVTAALSCAQADRALDAVSHEVLDADGGTAIGAALEQFLSNPRFLALARGALVIVLSDGLERGDPTAMVRSTERLSRLAHRLIWWSPLACSPTYRPITRGMADQLRSLDHLGGVRDLETGLAEIRSIPAVVTGPRRAAARRRPDPARTGTRT
ncbi:vWA domain-containing protein [Actinomadura sp. HBU206391]|uniref:vWA domain-containing protein n=1 Tax=Actinomadura sp. HBU206391 TaxID=2731692 RepID=UPI00165065DC|nr:VWA domain-containing protein [Actinomadura sp. HBU206391]MBC6461042.1 VWA domain-containing protein [Actinomadura sp. HBU206391]